MPPPPSRPSIPVESENEDLADDVTIEETELDDFVDMVFDQLETAKNYVRKIYRMYVRSEWNQDVEDGIITPLAQQLKTNGYNLLDVLQTLLKSKLTLIKTGS